MMQADGLTASITMLSGVIASSFKLVAAAKAEAG